MKKRIAAIAVVLVSAAAVGVALAYTGTGKVFHNTIQTSFVQVNVQQLQETEKGLQEATPQTAVLPGEKSSYIPRVTVEGRDSYVRLRFDVTMNDAAGIEITPEDVYGLDDDWVSIGNCFYCRRILKPGEYSDVFQGIKIPQFVSGELSGFDVKITADAIQSDNFIPDFTSNDPWGNISIQRSNVNGNVEKRVAAFVGNDELDFMDDNYIECSTDNLFENFEAMAAGDSRTDHLVLRNLSGSKRDIFFQTEDSSDVLNGQIKLRLICGDSFRYEGDLESEDLQSAVKIATLEPGEKRDFSYTLTLPASSDNQFQSLDDKVVWIFDSKQVVSENVADQSAVRTGDELWVKVVIALLICTCAAILILLLLFKRRKDEKDNGNYD